MPKLYQEDLPNAPKYQPCPQCHKQSKREEKLMGGANYRCIKHGVFFVKYPVR